jgi:hypothetical protein
LRRRVIGLAGAAGRKIRDATAMPPVIVTSLSVIFDLLA